MAALCRRAAMRAAADRGRMPIWSSDVQPVRGYCRGGTKRKPCKSRWGVTRLSLDFTDPTRIDRLATVECASCGRTWRRVPAIPARSAEGYLQVLLTLILPASAKRWYSHGTWHRVGDDAQVLRNATVADLDEAVDRHNIRAAKRADATARRKAAKEADDLAQRESARALFARLAERDAERAAEEAAAQAREDAQ